MFLRIYLGAVTVRYIDRNIYGCRPEIKIRYMDVNCALYLLQLSSAQKWKNRHLQQCTLLRKHCDRKSRQNRNLIWKPFSLLIRGPNGFKSWKKSQDTLPVQGQFYKIFFIKKQKLHQGPIWTGKKGYANFFFFKKIFTKNVCARSQRLRWHVVSVVNNYADTRKNNFTFASKVRNTKERSNKKCNLIFLKIGCLCSHWLCWHRVGVVIEYTDTCWNSR